MEYTKELGIQTDVTQEGICTARGGRGRTEPVSANDRQRD